MSTTSTGRTRPYIHFFFILVIGFTGGNYTTGYSQQIQIRVNYLTSSAISGGGDNGIEHTWRAYFLINTDTTRIDCFTKDTPDSGTPTTLQVNRIYTLMDYLPSSAFRIRFDGYEDDGGSRCQFFGVDDLYDSRTDIPLSLENLAPGVWHSRFISTPTSRYQMSYDIRYIFEDPSIEKIFPEECEDTPDGICGDCEVRLEANVDTPNEEGVTYQWYYNKDLEVDTIYIDNPSSCFEESGCFDGDLNARPGCCSEPPLIKVIQYVWRPISGANSKSYTLNYRDLEDFTASNFLFRLEASAGPLSRNSAHEMLTIRYPAPQFNELQMLSSCELRPSGTIGFQVTDNLKPGLSKYFVFESGITTSLRNDEVNSTTYSLSSLGAGDYEILMVNESEFGLCQSDRVPFTVSKHDPIDVAVSVSPTSCEGVEDGIVTLNATGSEPNSTFSFLLEGEASGSSESYISFSDLGAGEYSAVVSDGCMPSQNMDIEVQEPKRIQAEVDETSASCLSPANGEIHINISEGGLDGETLSAQYELIHNNEVIDQVVNTGVPAATFDGLPFGTYTISVKDADRPSCPGFITELTIQDSTLNAFSETFDQTCSYLEDGIIITIASAGIYPYDFSLNGLTDEEVNIEMSNTDGNFSGLAKGIYNVEISSQDDQCDDIVLFEDLRVDAPQPISVISSDIIDLSCFGGNDGEITVNISGGVPPYDYEWDLEGDELTSGENVIHNLPAGSYSLKVIDNNNCELTSGDYVVNEPAEINVSVAKQDISCYNSEDGKITVDADGGTGEFTWLYRVGSNDWQHFDENTGFRAGSYRLMVEDENQCSKEYDQLVQIFAPPQPLSASTLKNDVTCFNGEDGNIQVTITGGNGAGYNSNYLISVNEEPFEQVGTMYSLQGGAGSYDFTIRDNRDCEIPVPTVIIEQPEEITLTVDNVVNVECFNEATGAFEVSAQGGNGDYYYQIDGNTESQTGLFDQLLAGTYALIAYDQEECASTAYTVEITQPEEALRIESIASKQITCAGDDNGELYAEIGGGNENNALEWQMFINDRWESYSISDDLNMANLSSGRYRLRLYNSGGGTCEAISDPIELVNPAPIEVTEIDVQQITCKGAADGEVYPLATGGWGKFSYHLRQGEEEFEMLNLLPGTYSLLINDQEGCKYEYPQEIIIHEPDEALSFDYELSDYEGFGVSCFGSIDGNLSISPSGGNGTGFDNLYHYSIDGVSYHPDAEFSELAAGNYTVYLRDERNCIVTEDIVITSPDQILIGLDEVIQPSCWNSSDGTITVSAFQGAAPYSYEWIAQSITAPGVANITAGSYRVRVTDANNCTSEEEFYLEAPDTIKVFLADIRSLECAGNCDGYAKVQAEGGIGSYSFSWNDEMLQRGSEAYDLCPGTYTVTVEDENFCTENYDVVVNAAPPIFDDLGESRILCEGQEHLLDPGNPELFYLWTSSNGFSSDQQQIYVQDPGYYYLEAISAEGCFARDTFEIIRSPEFFEANFLAASDIVLGDTLVLTEICSPAPDSVSWSLPVDADLIDSEDYSISLKFREAGSYPIALTAYSGDCYEDIHKQIMVHDPGEVPITGGRITSLQGLKEIKVYPNPTSGKFDAEITLHQPGPIGIFLHDSRGVELARGYNPKALFSRFSYDLSAERSGIYNLIVVTAFDKKVLKVIKE